MGKLGDPPDLGSGCSNAVQVRCLSEVRCQECGTRDTTPLHNVGSRVQVSEIAGVMKLVDVQDLKSCVQ